MRGSSEGGVISLPLSLAYTLYEEVYGKRDEDA
jgi:hypothetical protein